MRSSQESTLTTTHITEEVKYPAAETAGRPLFESLFIGVIPAS
jgi:hypothetical protein